MAIVTEISWDDMFDGKPLPENPARQAWHDAVAEIAAKAKAKATLPECNGRVDAATKIVLAGDVDLLPDGTAKVASQSNGQTSYRLVNGTCDCKDYPKAPSGWCKHRIAAGMAKRATPLAKTKLDAPATGQAATPSQPVQPQASPAIPMAPLPEAPASVNVHVELAGRQVQLTLRDSDEGRLLARLEAILQRFPVAAKPADDTPHCPKHGVVMKLNYLLCNARLRCGQCGSTMTGQFNTRCACRYYRCSRAPYHIILCHVAGLSARVLLRPRCGKP